MSHRNVLLSPIALAIAVIMPTLGHTVDSAARPATLASATVQPSPASTATASVNRSTSPVTIDPTVTVRHGSPSQHRRLDLALRRFRDAGLALPDLEIVFASNPEGCRGHYGLFDSKPEPWRISICSDLDPVYEHELAHAWAEANLTDDERNGFMNLRGYGVWSDHSMPWNERGTEGAAFIIQQGLSERPLPPALSDEHHSRLAAFEFLTGVPDPRLAAWTSTYGLGEATSVQDEVCGSGGPRPLTASCRA
jgi:hypothetical protein